MFNKRKKPTDSCMTVDTPECGTWCWAYRKKTKTCKMVEVGYENHLPSTAPIFKGRKPKEKPVEAKQPEKPAKSEVKRETKPEIKDEKPKKNPDGSTVVPF